MTTRHLDLGCGDTPRNPFHADDLYGLDQSDMFSSDSIRRCQLGLEPIPFDSECFDSLSAFDVLEHIPRVALNKEAGTLEFPFVFLMNEVWRVLKPGGRFLALTPVYPAKQAFQDPTHVNIIADTTHDYFCGKDPLSRRYGFTGCFSAGLVKKVNFFSLS